MPIRRSIPRALILIIALAVIGKIGIYVSPWLMSKHPPPVAHHEHGTGFAVHGGPGKFTYVSEAMQSPSPAVGSTPTSTQVEPTSTDAADLPSSTSLSGELSFMTTNITGPRLYINKTGDTIPGLLFFGPRGNGTKLQAPMIIDQEGQLIWHGPEGTSTNMKLQTVKSKQHITFWQGTSAFTFGHGYGAVHILDDTYQEVAKICPDLDIVTELPENEAECLLDMHESYITERGTLITTAYNVTKTDLSELGGPSDGWVFDSMFYEIDIDTQEVIFRWRSLDHLDELPLNLTKYPMAYDKNDLGTSRESAFDFFHINSIQPLEDGYLLNSRHMWSVVKLDLNGSVGWRFSADGGGDFSLGERIEFSWQHHVRAHNITSSTMRLSLFDNANSEVDGYGTRPSKGMEIFLDWNMGDSLLLRTLEDPTDPVYASAMGSYQELPEDHVLVGYGKEAVFKEFNHTEQAVYSAAFGNSSTDKVVSSYRVYKYEWSAEPAEDPKLVAARSDPKHGTTLYASWNGATPDVYDGWLVEGGASDTELRLVGDTFSRTGFETKLTVPGQEDFYQVTACNGSSQVRTSAVVKLQPTA